MCINIVEKANLSKPVTVYDIATKKMEEVQARLGPSRVNISHSTAEAAANADIIFFSVPDDKIALSVLKEILTTDITGKVVVDCSTVHPDTSMQETNAVIAKGGSFVSCPVFGSATMSDAGQLIAVLAGEESAVAKIKPFCKGIISRATIDLSGEDPGKATLLKIIGNTFVLSMVGTLSEGHTLAEKTGLGTHHLHKFVQTLFPGAYTFYSERMISGDYYKREEPIGFAQLARKDAGHAQRLAGESGMKMKIVELVDTYLKDLLNQRGPKAEFSAVYGAKRVEAGLPFEN